jgi:hypothetical protein
MTRALLSDRERRLHARHVSLAEIGVEGQERLMAARVRVSERAHPDALAVATAYMERAGVTVAGDGDPLALPTPDEVAHLAGRPSLEPAAASLAGAFAAVEAIKRITSAGKPASSPPVVLGDSA